ncbi:MAG: WecB/TagA/CpsF family glycosyltransferase [Clostridia bacterium]|nr:WecB/TagA/CpsF family glycosyltransferase [Clostridia bacterium]
MREYFEKIENIQELEFFEKVKNKMVEEEKMFIVTANPETLMFAEKDDEFKKIILAPETTVVADGIGVIKGAKMLKMDLEHRILGVNLATKLLFYCNELEKSIYLLGAKPEVIEKMQEMISMNYPKAKLVGAVDGYVKDKDKIFDDIYKKQPDVVLVALGIPNQEKLIYKNYSRFNKGIFVGVGGSFDVISGSKKRAPDIFIKLNLEWLYRITSEPKRLKRFFSSNIKYMFKIIKERGKK